MDQSLKVDVKRARDGATRGNSTGVSLRQRDGAREQVLSTVERDTIN